MMPFAPVALFDVPVDKIAIRFEGGRQVFSEREG